MDSSAFRNRLPSAVLALALQAAFIFAFLHALPLMSPPKQLAHELIFLLPRLVPKPAPTNPQTLPRTPTVPVLIPAPLIVPLVPLAPSASAPPAALQNFGRALFGGCAPQTYNSLTPQQQAMCPHPGEGLAVQNAPDPLNTRSHVKDEAYWQEEQAEAHWTPANCPTIYCQMDDWHAEQLRKKNARTALAFKKSQALKPPEPQLPESASGTKSISVHPQ